VAAKARAWSRAAFAFGFVTVLVLSVLGGTQGAVVGLGFVAMAVSLTARFIRNVNRHGADLSADRLILLYAVAGALPPAAITFLITGFIRH
jgi:hypothetical protein